jgi:hypothetical protein
LQPAHLLSGTDLWKNEKTMVWENIKTSAICCSFTLTARRNVNQCKEQAIIT